MEIGPEIGREASGKGLKLISAGYSPHLRWRESESRLFLGVSDTMDAWASFHGREIARSGLCVDPHEAIVQIDAPLRFAGLDALRFQITIDRSEHGQC